MRRKRGLSDRRFRDVMVYGWPLRTLDRLLERGEWFALVSYRSLRG